MIYFYIAKFNFEIGRAAVLHFTKSEPHEQISLANFAPNKCVRVNSKQLPSTKFFFWQFFWQCERFSSAKRFFDKLIFRYCIEVHYHSGIIFVTSFTRCFRHGKVSEAKKSWMPVIQHFLCKIQLFLRNFVHVNSA